MTGSRPHTQPDTSMDRIDPHRQRLDEAESAAEVLLRCDLGDRSAPVAAALRRNVRALLNSIRAVELSPSVPSLSVLEFERRLVAMERLAFAGAPMVDLLRWPRTLPGRLDLACRLNPDEIAALDEGRVLTVLRDLRRWNRYLGWSPAAAVLEGSSR
ncbi:hypothetical protein [Leifsonia sp. Leaf336]|uniref:hypothetical protein n=1 Tax=Leifsonia sp. Leaf336 TaxID=1736341 RepID=UPI0012F91040|nr:hypothetical protein [Leifsonia sp. Leaf336]